MDAPKKLSLLDATLLVMGGIIGIGIFFNPRRIALETGTPGLFLGLWLFGGLVALFAAFTFAELGGTFPRTGGWFVYLREAFGPFPAFLFAWIVLFVVSTGATAAVTSFLAQQLGAAFPGLVRASEPGPDGTLAPGWIGEDQVAALAVLAVTAIALAGVKRTALVQNACMAIKLAALAAFAAIALGLGSDAAPVPAPGAASAPTLAGALSALRPVFFTYGGWQMAAYIAPEIRDPARNLPRAIVLGVLGVVLTYLVANAAYVSVLGIDGLAADPSFAAHIAQARLGNWGGRALALAMVISAFGWTIVTLLASPWLYVAMAKEGLFFERIARLSPRTGVPTLAFLVQAAVALVYVYASKLAQLVDSVVFVEWIFHLLVALALLRLRARRADLPRPFRSPLYPLAPLVYATAATILVGSTLFTAEAQLVVTGLAIVAAGALVYRPWRALVTRASA